MAQPTTEVAVVGAGPAGLTAALALARDGLSVTLIGTHAGDNRTTALLASSVTALEALGVWDNCRDLAAPLETMRIVDDTGRLWRAPEVRFSAAEIGLDAFGWNIENRHLVQALNDAVQTAPSVTFVSAKATAVGFDDDSVTITTESGERISARLVVAADGRHSLCRAAAGIASRGSEYPQIALTLNLTHSRPHKNISTEFHTAQGPFTLVPLPGARSSLVWVSKPADAAVIDSMDNVQLAREIERRSHSILGKVTPEAGRGRFPLRVEVAEKFSAHRIALVGEAAHTIPPIGAQGFNLGLRDAAMIAELVADAQELGDDIGAATVTGAYHDQRQADARTRSFAADLFNRSLLSDFLAVQGLRGLGLYMVDRIGPLRRAVMREGVAPASRLPRLMRVEHD